MSKLQQIFLLFFGSNTSMWVNLFILAVFIFSLYRIYLAWKKLKDEESKFNQLDDCVKDQNKNIEILKILDLLGKDGTLHKRLEEIHKSFIRGQKVTPELLDSIHDRVPLPSANSTKRVATSMVLLGLLGTLIGLSASISPMQSSLDESLTNLGSKSFQPIIYSMKSIISGIETAFSATILGVVTTLLLLFCIFLFERRKEVLEDSFELLMLTKILPFYNPVEKEESVTSLINSVKENTSVLRVLGDNSIRIGEDAKQQYELLVDSIAALTKSIAIIQEPFKEGNKVQQQMVSIVQGFTGSIAELKSTMVAMQDAVEKSLEGNKDTLGALKKTVELVESQRIDQQNLINTTNALVNKVDLHAEQLNKWTPETIKMAKSIAEISFEMSSATERHIQQFKEVHENTLEKVSAKLESVTGEMSKQVTSSTNKFLMEVGNSVKNIKTEIQEDIRNFEQDFQDRNVYLQEENKKLFETVNASLGNITKSFKDLTNATIESIQVSVGDGYQKLNDLIIESHKKQEELNQNLLIGVEDLITSPKNKNASNNARGSVDQKGKNNNGNGKSYHGGNGNTDPLKKEEYEEKIDNSTKSADNDIANNELNDPGKSVSEVVQKINEETVQILKPEPEKEVIELPKETVVKPLPIPIEPKVSVIENNHSDNKGWKNYWPFNKGRGRK